MRSGVNIVRLDFGELSNTTTQFGIGAFGQYNFSKHFRLDLEGVYHPMQNHVSDFRLSLDLQYLFHISEKFKLYPQIGYALAFQKQETYTIRDDHGSITFRGKSVTDGGFQVGAGAQYNLGKNWFVGAEYRYQPGALNHSHVVLASVGYRF